MAQFDADYYRRIWGTVHRHDYTADLAARLVATYGPGRYLDVGTGCGRLVAALRNLGVDAWGLDVSEYAVGNSCAPGYVRHGDIRDIPYPSGFDVVHSQGVWGYFPEGDVPRAWAECRRVGRIQHHNIDYDDTDPDHGYALVRDRRWWDNQFWPPVLVACPNHEVKEYAFGAWIDRVREFTYPNVDVLVVDNSPDLEFMDRWRDKVPTRHVDLPADAGTVLRINTAMEEIRRHFLAGDYRWWFNVESDVIPPADMIERMLEWGRDADWISHSYPVRGFDRDNLQQGIGCSMLSRRLVEQFSFADAADHMTPDGWLWNKVRPCEDFTTVEVWSAVRVEHLGTGRGHG